MIGKTISHYNILEKLGAGGMGEIYKAEDTRLKRTVALKFLPPEWTRDPDAKARFLHEAQAASKLDHPNICTVYEINETDDGQLFIAMAYYEGESLAQKIAGAKHSYENTANDSNQFIKNASPLPVKSAIEIAIQVAQGLQRAHEAGIIHRDIKPANVMITDREEVKIVDFGLAKAAGRTQLTKEGSTLGTVAYMSPEQTRGEQTDRRTDIWSLGVVVYEMLTGRLPFDAEYDQAVLYSICQEVPVPITSLRPDVPEALAEVIHRTLEKEPDKRTDSMAVLLDELNFQTSQRPSIATTLDFKALLRQPRFAIAAAILVLVLGAAAIWWFDYQAKISWARQEALPEIERLVEDINVFSEGAKPWTAFTLATEAAQYIPDDPMLARLWPGIARRIKIYSDPPGASVYAKPYADFNAEWRYLGQTPIDSIRLPLGFSRMKLEMEGFRTVDDVLNNVIFFSNTHSYLLPESQNLPAEMVLVQGGTFFIDLPGLTHLDAENVNDFLMDRYEVTNKAYKRFVDSGGYENQEYWKYPFVEDGTVLSWEAAMPRFTDKTGRPGPATWEVGGYPEGENDYPVTGVSWYEAAAFAEFSGKKLPTIYHWNAVALLWASSEIVPLSNLTGDGPVPVGSRQAMNRFGTYDLAGNVREWCLNESSRGGQHFILGGGWDDPGWAFNDAFARLPFDRSPTNGFRCIKYLKANENQAMLAQTIGLVFRDYFDEAPVSDEAFALFLRQYAYDKTPLNAEIEYEREEKDWIRQKITFDAAYGNERMMALLFLPKCGTPPYQTVVYFPGSTAIHSRSIETSMEFLVDFLPRDGRAVMYPIYKSTYERGDDLKSDYPTETNFYKEHVIMWAKDLGRSIDYLETRDDIDTDKLAYYGGSWGGFLAPIMLAVENRIKVAVLRGAGLPFESVLPEADSFHFLSRVKIPVLILNGRYDFFFPLETSQKPFFERLGTPEEHKVIRRYETGHGVPRAQRIKETLAWLDRYLGPVQ